MWDDDDGARLASVYSKSVIKVEKGNFAESDNRSVTYGLQTVHNPLFQHLHVNPQQIKRNNQMKAGR